MKNTMTNAQLTAQIKDIVCLSDDQIQAMPHMADDIRHFMRHCQDAGLTARFQRQLDRISK